MKTYSEQIPRSKVSTDLQKGYYHKMVYNLNRPLILTFETTSANESISVPGNGLSNYDFTIDWGDGTVNTFNGTLSSIAHTYTTQGSHDVKISGVFPQIYFANLNTSRTKLVELKQWGDVLIENMEKSFYGCTNLKITATDTGKFSVGCSVWTEAFRDCVGLETLGNTDMSVAYNLTRTFQGCTSLITFNKPLPAGRIFDSTWSGCTLLQSFGTQLTQCINLSYTWYNCSSMVDCTAPDTTNPALISLSNTWNGCASLSTAPLIDLSQGNVLTLSSTWRGCTSFTTFPSAIDLSYSTNLTSAWRDCSGLTSMPSLNIPSADILTSAFQNCTGLSTIPALLNFRPVNIQQMFFGCSGITTAANANTWNFEDLTNGSDFLSLGKLDTATYDSLIVNISTQTLIPLTVFNVGVLTFYSNQAAYNAVEAQDFDLQDGGLA